MAENFKNIKLPDPTEGVIRSAQVNDNVAPEDSVQLGVNVNFDRIGAISTRPGVSSYATALAGPVISLGYNSIQQTGVRRLLGQVGNLIRSWDGAAWTTVRTLTSSTNKARYSQFLNLTYMVNGNAAVSGSDAVQTFDGTTFGTTNVSFLPKGDFIQAGFEGRVWVLDAALDRLYYSEIASPTGVIITENPCAYIEKLSPQDGQSFTGVFRVPKALLIFKQNSIFRVYGASSVDPYPAYNVGTYSQESIVQAKDGVYFHHSSGFYRFNYDGPPTEISRRIKDFVDAIPRNTYGNITGLYDGKDNVTWAIGTVTVEGATYTNCMVRYTLSTQVWTIYDIAGSEQPTASLLYDNGTEIVPIIGTSTGKLGHLEDGETDFGLPIYFEVIGRFASFTDMWSHIKEINGMAVNSENGAGVSFQVQVDKQKPNVWDNVGDLKEGFTTLFPNYKSEDFNRMRYRIKGYTSGPQIIINGIEIMSLEDKGYDQN